MGGTCAAPIWRHNALRRTTARHVTQDPGHGARAAPGPPARDADKYSIGYIHNLSKRTAVYTTASYIRNKNGANFSLVGGAPGLAAGGKSTGAEVGIRHAF